MRSAFCVAVARPGRRLPDHVERLLGERRAPTTFAAGAHLTWRSTDGRTVVGCWQERPTTDDGGHRWSTLEDGIAVSTGTVRAGGKPWGGESTWTDAVVDAVARLGAEHAVDRLRGLFTAAVVDCDGAGAIVNDALAFAFLFHASADDFLVVSSEPALTAHAVSPAGAAPARDALGVAGLAHTHDRIGGGTGYTGVAALPPGAWFELRAGHSPRLHQRPHPWMPTEEMMTCSLDELVEQAALDIEDEILAARTYPAERHLADLTGGKDSRLVLAGMISAGAVQDFEFWTDGPPDLIDVQIARELAHELSLPFDSGLRPGRYAEGYLDRITTFVDQTAGMHSLWTLKSPPVDLEPWVRLNGLFGEASRSKVEPLATVDDAIRFRQRRFGRLELLEPDASAWWRKQVRRTLVDDAPAGATPSDLVDTFQWKERSRNSFGLREPVGGIPRIFPLYSLPLIRAAYALGDAGRRQSTLHREIMLRAHPLLVTHRLTGAGFGVPADHAAPASVAAAGAEPANAAPRVRPGPATPAAAGANLAVVMRANMLEEQTTALSEIFADATNPVWEQVDRPRALEALRRYGSLTAPQQRELAGAATAAVWLARR